MPDAALALTESAAEGRRFLTFRIGDRLYALPAEDVSEIIRIPPLARVPQAPPSLLGLANLRGRILPVASLRRLLGEADGDDAGSRAIVLTGAAPVAVAVDAVQSLLTVDASLVDARQAGFAAEPGELLHGALRHREGDGATKILDMPGMLKAAFPPRDRPDRRPAAAGRADPLAAAAEATDAEKLVTFDVFGQEFALPMTDVQEIVPLFDSVSSVPRADGAVLGVAAYRDTILPIMSLRSLLGLAPATGLDGREKIVVVRVRGGLVGLVADRMRAIVAAEPALLEPTPALLAARTGGESRIKALYRGEGGRRLVSILSPDQLFREDVMRRLGDEAPAARQAEAAAEANSLQILTFRLGDGEFGLPIETVDEVARVPDQITRVPRTPDFIEGVVNLRGEVLAVVDQRRRFDMPPAPSPEGRRMIVVRTGGRRAALIVDGVSGIATISVEAVEPAPSLTGAGGEIVQGVVNLPAAGRMVLLLDANALLTRTEQGELDAFEAPEQPAR
jgi:purine-binding chemotaxis protein CheW